LQPEFYAPIGGCSGRVDIVIAKRLAFAFVSILSASVCTAEPQGKRIPGWEPDTSMRFERTLEPSVYVDNPETCQALCMEDERCTGWTYYHPEFTGEGARETWEPLRGACVMGKFAGRNMQKAPGRTSGTVTNIFRCPPARPGVDYRSYVC
jgi:hypothetical protein